MTILQAQLGEQTCKMLWSFTCQLKYYRIYLKYNLKIRNDHQIMSSQLLKLGFYRPNLNFDLVLRNLNQRKRPHLSLYFRCNKLNLKDQFHIAS